MKVFLEDLEVQLALGKAEAKDAYERERKNFLEYVKEQKSAVKRAGKTAEEHRLTLADKFDHLENMLAKEVPASKRQFDRQKKDTLFAIYELEFAMKEAYGDVGLSLQNKLDRFKALLDAYRIQLALGDFENTSELESKKEALSKAVAEMQEKLHKEVSAGEKIDQFTDEMTVAFEHMKKGFSELFS